MDLNEPLAYRMMPKTLDDYVGQEHIAWSVKPRNYS